MDTYIKIAQFLLSLSLLIVLHELGHFIPAKIFKTRVEKFYLFFDYKFSLFKKKIGETVYGIGWIPLGGYVKIAGMIDESMDKEQMLKPPQPWEFRSKPAWQRLIIMLGGVTVNFLLGIFIYTMILNVWGNDFIAPDGVKNGFAVTDEFKSFGFQDGDKILKINGEVPSDVSNINRNLLLREINDIEVEHLNGSVESIQIPEDIGLRIWTSGDMEPFKIIFDPIINEVAPDSPAELAGIESGDEIVKVNEQEISSWPEFTKLVAAHEGTEPLKLTLKRDGDIYDVDVLPNEDRIIGVSYDFNTSVTPGHKDYGFFESVPLGFDKAYWTLKDYISQFKYVFTKKGATSLGGFITIGSIFPTTWDWEKFWEITAFLSIMLAFMNLLPIPALDGGHVVFTLYEMITGHKPSDKFLEYAQITGFVILMGLLLFANGNDIYKWLTGKF
ncbi:MAG: RIP metalloprotease RseP [Lutimonas sp.]